jgi:uncharacterized protein (DUF983 family)
MRNSSELLMRTGVVALCPDCGDEGLFVPVEDACAVDGCEFCCTRCDAAVFLLEVLENTGVRHARVA